MEEDFNFNYSTITALDRVNWINYKQAVRRCD